MKDRILEAQMLEVNKGIQGLLETLIGKPRLSEYTSDEIEIIADSLIDAVTCELWMGFGIPSFVE